MGMRLNNEMRRAAFCVSAALAAIMFFSCIGMSYSYADDLSASEREAQIAAQQAEEQQAAAQRAADQKAATDVIQAQLAEEATVPGVVKNLKVTTSTSTDGISSSDISKGKRYVNLYWSKAKNATRYEIYYRYMESKNFTKLKATVKTNSKKRMLFYNNKRELFLKVVAVHGDNKSKASETVVIWPGYGSHVNATKIKFTSTSPVLYTGFTGAFTVNTTASMLRTYKIKWTSSNSKVAKVNQSGIVTAVSNGTATITAKSHAGFTVSENVKVKTITPKVVPDVVGLSRKAAKDAIKAAGFNVKEKKVYIKKKEMNKKYPGVKMGRIMTQNKKAGSKLSKGSTVTIKYGDEIYDCGVGAEAMVKWAETVAADDSYGYSMGVYTGRGLDRLCPYTNSGASKDYDCATFVNAALAFSGMGNDFMKASVKPSPVVRGVRNLMIDNGWKKVLIKHKYKSNGKTKYYYTKPTVSQLKRGDVVLNCACHIQIHVGNGYDVGAHNNYDGKTGDSSGREVSVNYSWTGYNEVYRYYGNIGK